MTSFLSALRAAIPPPPISVNFASSSESFCDSPELSTPCQSDVQSRAYRDPFLSPEETWEPSLPSDLLSILQVDHDSLRSSNEREAVASSVSAVVTSNRHKTPAAPGKAKTTTKNVLELLLAACKKHTLTYQATCFFTSLELAESVLQTVQTSRGKTDEVQAQLFGLVGVEGMDLIAFAVQHQDELLASSWTSSSLEKIQKKLELTTERTHETDNWLQAADYDPEVLRQQQQVVQEARQHESTSLLQREFGALKGGYDSSAPAGQLMAAGAVALPANTKRTHYKGYEHVIVPAQAPKSLKSSDEVLVPITQLDSFAQSAFHGISTLNRLQSKLFDAAYHSNQNLLVCAPTGAGKTNVAMLGILQEVKTQRKRRRNGDKGDEMLLKMKVIYVAPMKALAQEIVTKFQRRLQPLKLQVKELTGDMQLTRKEMEATHVIVTTPEKWDVITRKSSTQESLLSQVKLLILDEVHLLADERGPVIETIVARTLRRVESSQSMIRILGLSATLPNYVDVASFLRVSVPSGDPNAVTNGGQGGLFYFDASYRPVPLDMTFIGVKTSPASLKEALEQGTTKENPSSDEHKSTKAATSTMPRARQIQLMMNKLTLAHCLTQVRQKEQVMVFVHSRKETAATLHGMMELARVDDDISTLDAFLPPPELQLSLNLRERVTKSRNKELKELLAYGMGIHHAGMLRSDRNLTEELFEAGLIRVLCCTATLAWGVNLPAHSVLIKGTQVYNAAKGGLTSLSMLDVMQIFGRAGRPQYDTRGDAVLVTTHEHLPLYLRSLTTGIPMESALIKALPDHLNAEIVSGTVSNLEEACTWLSYTYLYVRMRKNPVAYGIKLEEVYDDPHLLVRRRELLVDAAKTLAACRMIQLIQLEDKETLAFAVTPLGRVASHFYIAHRSIETFNTLLDRQKDEEPLTWDVMLAILCSSTEFEQLQTREDEILELEKLQRQFCRVEVRGGGLDTSAGKTNVLVQSLLSRARISTFTLVSDTNYVAQNGARVARALFELCLKQHNATRAEMFLSLAKCIEHKLWDDANPLFQVPNVPFDVINDWERRNVTLENAMRDPEACHVPWKVMKWIQMLPFMDIASVQTQATGSSMLKLTVELVPRFQTWHERAFQGTVVASWLWIEDAASRFIYYSEYFVLRQSQFRAWQAGTSKLTLECFLPLFASQKEASYVVRLFSDRFVGLEAWYDVTFAGNEALTTTKEQKPMETTLESLHPLALDVILNDVPAFYSLYRHEMTHLNPIQTHVFHALYHQDENVLLCTPPGSGKTFCAELAMLRVWKQQSTSSSSSSSSSLIVYLAPLPALAHAKALAWKQRFQTSRSMPKHIVEVLPTTRVDVEKLVSSAHVIVSTPDKWIHVLRTCPVLFQRLKLVIVDQIHCLNDASRSAAVLEVLLSRFRRSQTLRLVALSSTIANPYDVGHWLGIKDNYVWNFGAAARPVPLQVLVQGFPERQYVARMAAMNKPIFLAIQRYAEAQSVVIFVASKAQTRATALDLLQTAANSGTRFGKMDEQLVAALPVVDETLQHTLAFGIGLYHGGLLWKDREIVKELYRAGQLQVVICTTSVAWEEAFRAPLVVIKGTQMMDKGRFRSYAWSHVLQMLGRAGRHEEQGVVCVLVEENKKNMTQRWLKDPMTVESCLNEHKSVLLNEVNAEIASKTIQTSEDVMEWMSTSLLFNRVVGNPSFYGLKSAGKDEITSFFDQWIESTLQQLQEWQCITRESLLVTSTVAGELAAGLNVDVETVSNVFHALEAVDEKKRASMLLLLCLLVESSVEVMEIPLRQHEVPSLMDLCGRVKYSPLIHLYASSSRQDPKVLLETHGSQVKTLVLLQMHCMNLRLPSSELRNDLRLILDHCGRLLRTIIALSAYLKRTELVFAGIRLAQAVVQGQWPIESSEEDVAAAVLMQLPHVSPSIVEILRKKCEISTLDELQGAVEDESKRKKVEEMLQGRNKMTQEQVKEMLCVVEGVPRLQVTVERKKQANEDVIDVEVTTRGEKRKKTKTWFPCRGQSAKPYGFYVLLVRTMERRAQVLQLQHVAWNPPLRLSFVVSSSAPGDYRVHVLSDTIAGIESSHDV